MKPKVDFTLYLVTDRELMSTPTLEEAVENAIKGGCTLVQLREKDASSLDFYHEAMKLKPLCARYGVPLIINDRVDVALAVDADGVHVGQSDLPAAVVRRLIGPNKLLGVSVSHPDEVAPAIEAGADHLGAGAMFATNTKQVKGLTSIDTLKEIRRRSSVPIVAIGGINAQTVPKLAGTGIDGLAVVSAIIAQPDIEAAARGLKQLFLDTKDAQP